MKEKKKELHKETDLPDFFALLDTLLPISNQLLQEVLKKKKSEMEKLQKERSSESYLLEIEEEKVKCLEEVLGIVVDHYQRVSADYANFQKRAPKQIAEAVAFEKERIVKSILPAMDNFEHTLSHAEAAENVEAIAQGVKIIYDQMLDALKSYDVEQIKALGEKFDPSLHQAMMQTQDEGQEDGIVLEEYQKGYKLNDRVLRPAKVVVNKLPAEQETPPDEYDSEPSDETAQ